MDEEQIIDEQIRLKYETKKELERLKEKTLTSEGKEVRFKIETKHWYGFDMPFLAKDKDILNISKNTLIAIINEMLDKIKENIDYLTKKRAELRRK